VFNKNIFNMNNEKALKLAFVLLILLKLILVMGHKMYAIPEAGHDDGLMYYRAISIINGKWLGTYNNLILAKGAFFSLWLAFLHVLSVPMLIGNELLYVAACLFFLFCIKNMVLNKKILLLIFGVLLFNPATLGVTQILRIYRDGIFPALIIFILAGIIGVFLKKNDNKKMLMCSILSGIGLSAAWHTREDAFWVLPFVIAAAVITAAFLAVDRNCKDKLRKFVYLILPFFLLIASNLLVSSLNYIAYGRFVVNDYMSKDFQGAYGALTRVAHEQFDFYNPVPEEIRMKIYQVSPAFNELKPFLDEGPLEGWKTQGKRNFNWPLHDYYSWFMWALRDAVMLCGYYENPQKAKAYYERLAKEINDACDNGLLPVRAGKRSTLATPFSRQYMKPTIKSAIDAALFVIKGNNIYLRSNPRQVSSPPVLIEYRKSEIFLNQLAAYVGGGTSNTFLSGWVFDESENIDIRVIDSLNQEVDAKIIKSEGPDVYNHFNRIYETALNSRFSIEFDANEDLDYYLYFSNETGEQVSILIGNNTSGNGGSVSTIKYHIDNASIGNLTSWDTSIYNTRVDNFKYRISNLIVKIYVIFNPVITIISVLSLLMLTGLIFYSLKKKTQVLFYEEVIILWGLFFIFFARTVMIAYVSASSFPAINVMYLSSSYPIVIMFNCISICCIYNFVKKYIEKLRIEKKAEKNA